MLVEVGDIVSLKNEKILFGLKIIAIKDKLALCSYWKPNCPLNGNIRPTELIAEQIWLPVNDLKIIRKKI